MNLLELCNWRYATKKLDPSKSVSKGKVERILEAARMAPTSSGLQPLFRIIVITDPSLKAKIQSVAMNQPQVMDCSHLLVFAAWDNYTADRINTVFDQTNMDRGETIQGWEDYRKMLLDSYPARSAAQNFEHAARQAYIGLGFAMLAAANEQVDCTPMEGFDPLAVDAILNLSANGLRSVLLLPLGYRDAGNDWLVGLKKSRTPREDFIMDF